MVIFGAGINFSEPSFCVRWTGYYIVIICWLHEGAVSVLSVGWVQWLSDSTSHPQYEVGTPKWRVIRRTPTSLGKCAKPPHQMNTNRDRVASVLQNKWSDKWKTYEFKDPTKPSTRGLGGKFHASTSIPRRRVKSEGCQSQDVGKDSDDGDRNKTWRMTRR